MPQYEVTRSYRVVTTATLEAKDPDEAIIKALGWEGHWKEYEGDYDDELTVELVKETTDDDA